MEYFVKFILITQNFIMVIFMPIISYIFCLIQKAILKHKICSYMPVYHIYIFLFLRNIIYEFFIAGFYLSIFIDKFQPLPFVAIIFLDISLTIIRKYKILERIYIYYYSQITNGDDELEYYDIDNINEICYIEIQFYVFFYITTTFIFNFIHILGKDYDLIDCKGTPNPRYFIINKYIVSTYLFMIIIRFLVYYCKETIETNCEYAYKSRYPAFNSYGMMIAKLITIHGFLMKVGSEMFALGMLTTKFFRY